MPIIVWPPLLRRKFLESHYHFFAQRGHHIHISHNDIIFALVGLNVNYGN
jgi:hypothetical protein